jgi:hypothetical protein
VARSGDVLRPRGDGAGDPARPDRRHYPAPHRHVRQQCAGNKGSVFDGFLLGKRYPPHDRDTKFTRAFDGPLMGCGGELVVLPPRSLDLNACRERFVRSSTDEDRTQMLRRGERSLYWTIQQSLRDAHADGAKTMAIAPLHTWQPCYPLIMMMEALKIGCCDHLAEIVRVDRTEKIATSWPFPALSHHEKACCSIDRATFAASLSLRLSAYTPVKSTGEARSWHGSPLYVDMNLMPVMSRSSSALHES